MIQREYNSIIILKYLPIIDDMECCQVIIKKIGA